MTNTQKIEKANRHASMQEAIVRWLFGYDVFISYRWQSEVQTFVQCFVKHLDQMGVDAFVDEHSVEPGESLPSAISRGIDRSRVFLIFVTDGVCESKWMPQELSRANQRKRKILPVGVNGSIERLGVADAWTAECPQWKEWPILKRQKQLRLPNLTPDETKVADLAAQVLQSLNRQTTKARATRAFLSASLGVAAVVLSATSWALYATSETVRIQEEARIETEAQNALSKLAASRAERAETRRITAEQSARNADQRKTVAEIAAQKANGELKDIEGKLSDVEGNLTHAERELAASSRDLAASKMDIIATRAVALSYELGSEAAAVSLAIKAHQPAKNRPLPQLLLPYVSAQAHFSMTPPPRGFIVGDAILNSRGNRLLISLHRKEIPAELDAMSDKAEATGHSFLRDLRSGEIIATFNGIPEAWSQVGDIIVMRSGRQCSAHSLNTGKLIANLPIKLPSDGGKSISLSADGSLLWTSTLEPVGKEYVFDVKSRTSKWISLPQGARLEALTRDGRAVLDTGTYGLWNLSAKKLIKEFPSRINHGTYYHFDASESKVVSLSPYTPLQNYLFDGNSGLPLRSFDSWKSGPAEERGSAIFTDDLQFYLDYTGIPTCELRSTRDGNLAATVQVSGRKPTSLAVSLTSREFVVGCEDGTILCYEFGGNQLWSDQALTSTVKSVQTSAVGTTCCISVAGQVRIGRAPVQSSPIRVTHLPIGTGTLTSEGSALFGKAVGDLDIPASRLNRLYDLKTENANEINIANDEYAMRLSSDRKALLLFGTDVRRLSIRKGESPAPVLPPLPSNSRYRSGAASSDGKYLCAISDKDVYLKNLLSGRITATISCERAEWWVKGHLVHYFPGQESFVVVEKTSLLIVRRRDGAIQRITAIPPDRSRRFPGLCISGVAFDEASGTVAAITWGGRVCVWDVRNGTLVAQTVNPIDNQHTETAHLKFIGSGSLAILYRSGELMVWKIKQGAEILPISKLDKSFTMPLVVSPDCRHVAVGDTNNGLRLYDARDWKLLYRVQGASSSSRELSGPFYGWSFQPLDAEFLGSDTLVVINVEGEVRKLSMDGQQYLKGLKILEKLASFPPAGALTKRAD